MRLQWPSTEKVDFRGRRQLWAIKHRLWNFLKWTISLTLSLTLTLSLSLSLSLGPCFSLPLCLSVSLSLSVSVSLSLCLSPTSLSLLRILAFTLNFTDDIRQINVNVSIILHSYKLWLRWVHIWNVLFKQSAKKYHFIIFSHEMKQHWFDCALMIVPSVLFFIFTSTTDHTIESIENSTGHLV